ncbi:MAG: hypothetical protein K0S29_636 [Gammaproteobacteria bacterium]|jgi:hypothetical protein|nr:hypothetical protein [Gammaproteobacteria bacterium]
MSKSELQLQDTDSIVIEFGQHPFTEVSDRANYKTLLANFFAMSQAFPYLQAGSQKDVFLPYLENNQDVPEHVELTSVVGNFLCWDETGGLYPTIAQGLKALPKLLETRRFHANILRSDCEKIFGESIRPSYSAITANYLKTLYEGLSSPCSITRVAFMVSFETHAHTMISALWETLAKKFDVPKQSLSYFGLHVGGEDPAEAYHVEMTENLISRIVGEAQKQEFDTKFKQSLELHYAWCRDIVNLSENQLSNRGELQCHQN